MNEIEKKHFIEKNKELLKEKELLEIEKYETIDEIKYLEDCLKDYINKSTYENCLFDELKTRKNKEFIINMLQIAIVFSIIPLGLSISILNINPAILSVIYKAFGIIYGLTGFTLKYIYNDDLKDYKKNVGLEYFEKENLYNLEEAKNVKEEELKKINKRLNNNSNKLDNLYNIAIKNVNMSIDEMTESLFNNDYSNSDETVKPKQKKIEKRK